MLVVSMPGREETTISTNDLEVLHGSRRVELARATGQHSRWSQCRGQNAAAVAAAADDKPDSGNRIALRVREAIKENGNWRL